MMHERFVSSPGERGRARGGRKRRRTGLNTWMFWFLETKWELLAMHVAVSSLSPVSIQI